MVAIPKSDIFKLLFSSSRRFSGFKSRCATPRVCKYCTPLVNWLKYRRASVTAIPTSGSMRSNSSPPAAYSRNMYSMSFWQRVPKYRRICLWWSIFWMHTSFFTDVDASGCFFVSTIFMATASFVWRFNNSFTLQKKGLAREKTERERERERMSKNGKRENSAMANKKNQKTYKYNMQMNGKWKYTVACLSSIDDLSTVWEHTSKTNTLKNKNEKE